ncbi:DUF998 domain-containing protein [Amycolatopsis sp.]|uniref:DUF998 domain-containing protein n=1 Tax=Amycolatopsis sp. TaxID=37632 RepID=UPI002BD64473|nr:DUF998 domain-containing protein [Amycolatopsis sp.]HVV07917.1 DUF998 domain-containing protein [Amycolatopsis sp.]
MTAPPARAPAALAASGVLALAAGAVLVFLLQFLPPTNEISPLRRTISEYALTGNKWLFDIAVVLVAAGSALLFALHFLRRALPAAALVAGALWTVSLLVIVAFPKTNWAVGPSAGGTLHRVASVIGFVCLPLGLLLAARTTFPAPRWRRAARVLAAVSLGWFGVILAAVVVTAAVGGHWWEVIPLGLVERLMALTELLAIATLAAPLLRSPGY